MGSRSVRVPLACGRPPAMQGFLHTLRSVPGTCSPELGEGSSVRGPLTNPLLLSFGGRVGTAVGGPARHCTHTAPFPL